MKKIGIFLVISSLCFGFSKNVNDGKIYSDLPWCYVSGNDLHKTYKTNYVVTLNDNSIRSYSAIRYLAQDYEKIKKNIKNIQVIDISTNNLIDASMAYYVVNSKIEGSYSKFSKFAFADENNAKEFIKKYGGDIRDFGFTLYLATRDLDQDNQETKKDEKKLFFRGQKIKEKMCANIDKKFDYIYQYMQYIKNSNICGNLNDKNLQALSYYMVNTNKFQEEKIVAIDVPKEAKCPVCGMFVAKYPRWAAQSVSKTHTHYFDGNKDFFKFILDPKKFKCDEKIDKMYVTDYYTLEKIDATKAFFVYGSNVLGPMGNEVISFKDIKSAETFRKEHFGKAIYSFDKIDKNLIYSMD